MISRSKHFPYTNYSLSLDRRSRYRNVVVLGIGGNLKDCVRTFENLFMALKRNARIMLSSTSILYKNRAFGYEKQPDFWNSTMTLLTSLPLVSVFSYMFYLERRFGRGRLRAFKNAPRTLDIDMLFFNNTRLKLPHIHLPHKHYRDRASVLVPLWLEIQGYPG